MTRLVNPHGEATTWAYTDDDQIARQAGAWGLATDYTYDAQNQLTGGQGLGAFAYDERGNPTTYNGASVAFDADNNATDFGGLLSAGYMSGGLRAWKQTPGGQRAYFLYDGATPVLELAKKVTYSGLVDPDTGLQPFTVSWRAEAVNTWGAGGLVSRAAYRGGGGYGQPVQFVPSYYAYDERGNASEVIGAGGQVRTRHVTDAYGNTSTFNPDGTAFTGGTADPYAGFGGTAKTRRFARVWILHGRRDGTRAVYAPLLRPEHGPLDQPRPHRLRGRR